MRTKWIFIIFLLLLSGGLSRSADTETQVSQSLQAEFSLAVSTDLYIVFDIPGRKIDLKAKGIILRTWKIEKIRLWGDPIPLNPASLLKKSALFPPQREDIKPGETDQETTFELETLELSDMPSSYTLRLEQNISMYIGPQSTGWTSFLRNIGYSLRWHFYPPLKTVWTKVKKQSFTVFEVTLENKEESQAFYWALGENSPFLILPF
ncbi:MAG: hypothetical protein WBF32_02230 [Candidatus Aminicenantaceae bacterium]